MAVEAETEDEPAAAIEAEVVTVEGTTVVSKLAFLSGGGEIQGSSEWGRSRVRPGGGGGQQAVVVAGERETLTLTWVRYHVTNGPCVF